MTHARTTLRFRLPMLPSTSIVVLLVTSAIGSLAQTVNNVNGNGNVVGGNVNVGSVNNNFGGDHGEGHGHGGGHGGGHEGGEGGGDDEGGEGGGTGDPLMLAFDGTLFFFHGEPNSCYNLLSDSGSYQVSAKLKEANNAVHIGSATNGTYMEAIGFQQEGARIEVSTFADDSARLVVKVNGEEMSMHDIIAHTSKTTLPLKDGFVSLSLSLFEEHRGTVVTIVTPSIRLNISLVPPGLDVEGYWQASYLNINATMLRSPLGTMQGVIGDTYYAKAVAGGMNQVASLDSPEAKILPTHLAALVYPVFPDSTYKLGHLFDTQAFEVPADVIQGLIQHRRNIACTFFTTLAEGGEADDAIRHPTVSDVSVSAESKLA